ncbi:DNA-binding protein [Colwellia ponticola]|uniref:DNA-binding protein n=2 Tax=Colwellia ponticola TaxID=2304625 RepID=A0A8H2JNY3_9GAMM|nr:DNA-binding protein [Colwellia ponticola]
MVGRQYGRIYAWDRINEAMVRQWCEIMGVDNPLYTDAEYAATTEHGQLVAPPAMLQGWCLAGFGDKKLAPGSTDENPYGVLEVLEKHGYPAVVAVNSNLTFDRYITMGEKLYYTTVLDSVSEEKTTALGTGFFVTLKMTYFSEQPEGLEDEKVGDMMFRVIKFKPAQKADQKSEQKKDKTEVNKEAAVRKRPKPAISDDNRFFWEGFAENELRIQACNRCKKLQHPPAPVCMHCHTFDLGYQVASGKGELYSFVVMHYPHVAPFDSPNPIGLIELEEGVRIPAGLIGLEEGESPKIGQKVQVEFHTFDGELTLPQFRLVPTKES